MPSTGTPAVRAASTSEAIIANQLARAVTLGPCFGDEKRAAVACVGFREEVTEAF